MSLEVRYFCITVSSKGREESTCRCKAEVLGFWLQGMYVLVMGDSALERSRNVETEGEEEQQTEEVR